MSYFRSEKSTESPLKIRYRGVLNVCVVPEPLESLTSLYPAFLPFPFSVFSSNPIPQFDGPRIKTKMVNNRPFVLIQSIGEIRSKGDITFLCERILTTPN